VTNTPWGERHAYVIAGREAELDKSLHVSPFMPMDRRYIVRAGLPDERLGVRIESRRGDAVDFDAVLALQRIELTARSAARVTRRYPLAGARVLALIYARAGRLKLAGATVYPHPGSGPRPRHVNRRDAPVVAAAVRRACLGAGRPRLRRALPPAVDAVPELLRGGLCRAADPRSAAGARQAGPAGRGAGGGNCSAQGHGRFALTVISGICRFGQDRPGTGHKGPLATKLKTGLGGG
jgi:Protein of unknown function (DUF1365)